MGITSTLLCSSDFTAFLQTNPKMSEIGIEMCYASILLTVTFTFLLLALFHSIFAKCFFKRSKCPLPPGPKPWPLVGCLISMCRNKPAFRWIHKLMRDMNLSIICIRLGNVHVISVSNPEIAREFLKKQDSVFSTRPICMSADLTSGGYRSAALVPLGDQWKKMRKVLATDILSPARHKWLHCKRVEEADHLVRYVLNRISLNGGLVNVRVVAQHYCGNVIRKLVFGKRSFGKGAEDGGPGEEEVEHVAALFTILNYLYSFCLTDYVPFLRWITDFDRHERIIKAAIHSCRKYQDPLVNERFGRWKNGMKTEEDDLLDVLINVKDSNGGPQLTVEEIKAQIVELMIATVDNPSNAIEWALAEMINQPHLLEMAYQELDRVVGRDRLVQESDLPRLNYVKACARESFRLHPIAPFNVPHVSVSDTTVAGYFIPKGSHVLLSRPGLGRNPEVWEEPLRFNPERHLKDDGSEVVLTDHELRMLSFSTGRRGCAGILLGSTMTTMLLGRLLQCFSWQLPPNEDGVDLTENYEDLLLAKPLVAKATPRLPEHVYPTA